MTGRDPNGAFELREEPRPSLISAPPNKSDQDKLRETWGTGPDVQRGLQAALGVAAQARKR